MDHIIFQNVVKTFGTVKAINELDVYYQPSPLRRDRPELYRFAHRHNDAAHADKPGSILYRQRKDLQNSRVSALHTSACAAKDALPKER